MFLIAKFRSSNRCAGGQFHNQIWGFIRSRLNWNCSIFFLLWMSRCVACWRPRARTATGNRFRRRCLPVWPGRADTPSSTRPATIPEKTAQTQHSCPNCLLTASELIYSHSTCSWTTLFCNILSKINCDFSLVQSKYTHWMYHVELHHLTPIAHTRRAIQKSSRGTVAWICWSRVWMW